MVNDTIGNETPHVNGWTIIKYKRRGKVMVTFNGVTKSLVEWAKELGKGKSALYKRIVIRGESIETAFEKTVRKRGKHNKSYTREFAAWASMVKRCGSESHRNYHDYGGRGIKVCERWALFTNFLEDMGERPSPKHSIDRFPNNDGNYEPGNCRWATQTQQLRNKRTSRRVTFNGQTKCVSEWAEDLGVHRNVILSRLQRGWSVEKSLTKPVKSR